MTSEKQTKRGCDGFRSRKISADLPSLGKALCRVDHFSFQVSAGAAR
jgi:hypothetical protein